MFHWLTLCAHASPPAIVEVATLRHGNTELVRHHEGTADIMAMAMNGDPVVGEYVEAGGLRDVGASRVCGDDFEGEWHKDGEVLVFGGVGPDGRRRRWARLGGRAHI